MQIQKKVLPLHRFRTITLSFLSKGEMVEWSITTVLKTVVPRGTGGSNPSLSAINLENQGFTKQVHENVHENASKQMFWGVFFIRK